MNTKSILIVTFGICANTNIVHAAVNVRDTTVIQIGKPAPDVTLRNLINYPQQTVKLSAFKGKSVILDFWATWCQPCVAMIPKMEELQNKFPDQLQVVMVNNEEVAKVKSFFTKMGQFGKYDLPNALDNKAIFSQFGVGVLPHYVWIDKQGIIKAVTGYQEMTIENVTNFIAGKEMKLEEVKAAVSSPFDINVPLFIEGNGDSKTMLYHSVISGYLEGQNGSFYKPTSGIYSNRRILARNLSLLPLYRVAFSKDYEYMYPMNQVIMTVNDTLTFSKKTASDKRNKYCYDLILPTHKSEMLFKIMQDDLARFFGIKGNIEKRMTRCLVLIKNKPNLTNTGSSPELDKNYYWVKMKNQPFGKFVEILDNYMQLNGLPFVDETGIKQSIDLSINAKLSDIPAVKKELGKYGLDLIIAERLTDMLVLSDH